MLPQGLPVLRVWTASHWKVAIELHLVCFWLFCLDLICIHKFTAFTAGDQVNKKGGMTGGFYETRRSKLKFMSTIRQNMESIKMKEEDLNKIRNKLQNILLKFLLLLFLLIFFFLIFGSFSSFLL